MYIKCRIWRIMQHSSLVHRWLNEQFHGTKIQESWFGKVNTPTDLSFQNTVHHWGPITIQNCCHYCKHIQYETQQPPYSGNCTYRTQHCFDHSLHLWHTCDETKGTENAEYAKYTPRTCLWCQWNRYDDEIEKIGTIFEERETIRVNSNKYFNDENPQKYIVESIENVVDSLSLIHIWRCRRAI